MHLLHVYRMKLLVKKEVAHYVNSETLCQVCDVNGAAAFYAQ